MTAPLSLSACWRAAGLGRLAAPFVALLLALVWLAPAPAQAQQGFVAVPPLTQRVTDQTGTLSAAQRSALENVLADYERQRGSQIFVLMLPTTAPETIEAYGIRVADAWRAGRKGIDDGVIVLIAKDNPTGLRKMRLEVGRGVQGSLTDAMSKRILQDIMAPHFRQNDFYGGLAAGISAIQATIDKEALPGPQPRGRAQDAGLLSDWLPVLFPLAIIVFFLIGASRQRKRGIVVGRRGWDNAAGTVGGLGGLGGMGGWGRHHGGGFGGGGFGGGGFGGGGGGGFDGGGASGNW
ncbi:YgcG family protein [Cupriavidus sp. AU9028]|uniref:TPM domain-containing protein n=1 Tax=Cupriavidus sp. AU9028 TaxID=2871157 RepID=UPI001C964C65|nr:YgcG family protein [Cupriavidus sp. AU9028]MBY4895547.1 YgcG family protein [Cupriavidus sp. AU9028]